MKDLLKAFLGSVLGRLFPDRARALREGFTLPRGRSRIDRLIRASLASDAAGLEGLHKSFWNKADWYFAWAKGRTEGLYSRVYADLVAEVGGLLDSRGIHTVCEFGTGDGTWLNHLEGKWASVRRFVGIDISEHQVEANRRAYPSLEFHCSELVAWARQGAGPRSLFHTNNGVLEYLSEASVRELLRVLKARAPGSLVLFIEPVYGDFDPAAEPEPRVIGEEHSFSHPHARYLTSEGIPVLRTEERAVGGIRMTVTLGEIA